MEFFHLKVINCLSPFINGDISHNKFSPISTESQITSY